MKHLRFVGVLTFPIVLALLSGLSFSQEKATVLTPENANEARLNRLQPPEQVMDAMGIEPGMTVAEIGAGHGRYVVQLATRVGENGMVYAEDIDADVLEHLKNRCRRWGLNNVEAILGDVTDPKLPAGELDLIFIISTYHHFQDPVGLLKNARHSLKKDGTLAIGEWFTSTPREKVIEQVQAAGFRLDRFEAFLEKNNLYLYIFKLDERTEAVRK